MKGGAKLAQVKALVLKILETIRNREGFATKTKLLKLLYLADIEHYRDTGKTLTGFRWVFHLYGPWASEYDGLLTAMQKEGLLLIKPGSRPDLDTQFVEVPVRSYPQAAWLECSEMPAACLEMDALMDAAIAEPGLSFAARMAIREAADTWACEPTGELLNYVYFHTEPMQHARRGEKLDFSAVRPRRDVPIYRRTKSSASSDLVRQSRRRLVEGSKPSEQREPFTPPKYDEQFFAAISHLQDDAE